MIWLLSMSRRGLRDLVPHSLNDRLAHRLGVAGRLLRTTADAELSVVGLSGPASRCCDR